MPENGDSRDSRKVFVIHGRNEAARRGLFEFLRAIGLDPIEWSEAVRMTGSGSPYIGDVLDAAFNNAAAVVVLETPDDVVYLHDSLTHAGDPECSPQMQARPNVLFEAGMAIGRDPQRTIIVELGTVKTFSDIHGRHVVRLDNGIGKRQELANRLRTAGCAVRTDGMDWHHAGDLNPPLTPGRGLPLGRKMPSSQATGQPRLGAKYVDNGSCKMGAVQITNHGPGDAFEVNVTADEQEGLAFRADEFPVPKLPAGKSVQVTRVRTLGSGTRSYFTVTITAKTADGTPFEVEEFVSGA